MNQQTEGEVPLPLRHRHGSLVGFVGAVPPSPLCSCTVGSPHPPRPGALGPIAVGLGLGLQPPLGRAES